MLPDKAYLIVRKVAKRWRAEVNCGYYYVACRGNVDVDVEVEHTHPIDDGLHNHGNYFRTREQAEEASRRIKKALGAYHEEIGE